ncbi:hypothetical protein [Spirosoma luteum]|uniref:hypothetical protein n=1 Tax=Spirosoma luteum TaxID=431553 RepID=UPI000375924A|nr:hypothetical protein [Spirosoma luteum]
MAKKEMNVNDFAKLINYHRSGVTKALRDGRTLPGIVRSRQVGKVWVLTVDTEQVKIKAGKK